MTVNENRYTPLPNWLLPPPTADAPGLSGEDGALRPYGAAWPGLSVLCARNGPGLMGSMGPGPDMVGHLVAHVTFSGPVFPVLRTSPCSSVLPFVLIIHLHTEQSAPPPTAHSFTRCSQISRGGPKSRILGKPAFCPAPLILADSLSIWYIRIQDGGGFRRQVLPCCVQNNTAADGSLFQCQRRLPTSPYSLPPSLSECEQISYATWEIRACTPGFQAG